MIVQVWGRDGGREARKEGRKEKKAKKSHKQGWRDKNTITFKFRPDWLVIRVQSTQAQTG